MYSLLPPNSIFRGYMNFSLLPENVFLAHESFFGCFSTIIFNTCNIGKMLRAPKARAEIFPPPHLLDRGYAPELRYVSCECSGVETHCGGFMRTVAGARRLTPSSMWAQVSIIRISSRYRAAMQTSGRLKMYTPSTPESGACSFVTFDAYLTGTSS